MPIEQAIFTSARIARGDGYQLVSRSPGISDIDAQELSVWGPSHGSLSNQRDEATSINFSRLSSGNFCISKTVAAGEEYSGRGGARVYTHFLLVPADVLARFANNPFAVVRAAWAKGVFAVLDRPPEILNAFSLVGRSAMVDEGLLAQLADQWGPQRVARLVVAAMTPGVKLLSGARHCETLIGGLLNSFPVECRTELTFTTGLRFSPRRPFRLQPSSEDDELRRSSRQEGVIVIDLANAAVAGAESTGWSGYVAEAIASDQLPRLASALQVQRPGFRIDQLDELGNRLLSELGLVSVAGYSVAARSDMKRPFRATGDADRIIRTDTPRQPAKTPTDPAMPAVALTTGSPAESYTLTDPRAMDLVEQFDDSVFDAINGAAEGIDNVTRLWATLAASLNPAALTATREQYLRYTLSLWDARSEEGLRDPDRAIRALDVLMALFAAEQAQERARFRSPFTAETAAVKFLKCNRSLPKHGAANARRRRRRSRACARGFLAIFQRTPFPSEVPDTQWLKRVFTKSFFAACHSPRKTAGIGKKT